MGSGFTAVKPLRKSIFLYLTHAGTAIYESAMSFRTANARDPVSFNKQIWHEKRKKGQGNRKNNQ